MSGMEQSTVVKRKGAMAQCLRCGGVGHFAKECSQPPTCNNCGSKGHLAKACPAIRCDRCGKAGHMARECTRGMNIRCYECGEPGHHSKDCPKNQKRKRQQISHEQVKKSQELNQYHRAKAQMVMEESAKTAAGASLWDSIGVDAKTKKIRLGTEMPLARVKARSSQLDSNKTNVAAETQEHDQTTATLEEKRESEVSTAQAPQQPPASLGMLANYDSESESGEET